MYVRGGTKGTAAMLFLLFSAAACAAASNGRCVPQCKTAEWRECVPFTGKPQMLTKRSGATYACVTCRPQDNGVDPRSPFSFLATEDSVAIRGYPFHVLSANSLTPLDPSVIYTLALIDANITDVENNTFAGVSSVKELSLDSNRLTHVKQTWFTAGLGDLFMLILSNNLIKQVDPGSFMHLTKLYLLDLKNNLLQVVDPAWLFGLKHTRVMNLGSNAITSISPTSFRHLQLTWLDLRGNDLSCLDADVIQSSLPRLHVSSGMLSSVHDAKPHMMTWSLHRFVNPMKGSATLVVQVPMFLFCTRHNANELSFGWMFDSLSNVSRNIEMRGINPGKWCGNFEHALNTISIQAPVVVLATDGSSADRLVSNTLEQCRQVWEYDGGIAVGATENSYFRLVSMATGNATFEGVAMSFVQTQDINKESGYGQKRTTHTNATHDDTKNITCILLSKDEHMGLYFTVPQAKQQTQTTATTFKTDTDHYTNHQLRTTPGPEVPPATEDVLIPVVVSVAVVSMVVSSLVVVAWKVCASRLATENGRASDDAHIWTIPPGVAFPGLLRSASLPASSRKMASDDVASCRSLPAVLHCIEPTYCEIPDGIAAAQRPLPGPPQEYSEIPDDAISGVVRSTSLPAVTCTHGSVADDAASCRSLPAVLLSIEPTYSDIPDHIAAAQRLLPVLPGADWEVPDHEAAVQCPLPAPRHTYSEIPDDDSGPMPFYAGAAECSLHVVRNRRQKRSAFRDNTTASGRPGRSFATYGSAEQTKAERNNFYRTGPEVQSIRARRNLRTGLISQVTEEGLRTYVNVTDAILSRGQSVTESHIALLTLPNTYWPWEISGQGSSNTPRRASLPLVTLPNTYWPWKILGDGTRNASRRVFPPVVTPPNTDTYCPCDMPGEGTRNIPQHASLSTLPNTYWPWEMPGEGSRNTAQREPLPLTLPNTYWPWEILPEGTRSTARRASLPLSTLPNTYWPWEMPGEGSRNTAQREPLPLTLPNTYWPWEILPEGTRSTARRASLPLSTLPNTYWPWEMPGEGSRNTAQREPLPLTLPNTYWPWEILPGGTRNTGRRASLSISTLPNTYWPWEIPGKGPRNTPRRASPPLVTPHNTYWPWEVPEPREGTRNTTRRASLPLVTLPNTYWPWEIRGDRSCNTPSRVPLSQLHNTNWPWQIPDEHTRTTSRRASDPLVTQPNT
ncbi:SLITRK6 [Branchiostoma lanceolatum]|uniref:SLITRK6 protein n=1 Tax=Branchiostoma lanceolatum TaxID=7740 RepID=A0A8K0EGL6_BRALA|nr:SLITRK6 [Branchiostoma lanceolatum]